MHAVSFRGIVKRFGSLLANDSVSFDVEEGTVHALLGENGAGKTTLLSVLAGFLVADEGKVVVNGITLEQGSPRESLSHGIGLCAQHFLLAGALTGAENVLLGRPGCHGLGAIPRERIAALERLAGENGLDVPLDLPVDQLSIAEQERLEILKLRPTRLQDFTQTISCSSLMKLVEYPNQLWPLLLLDSPLVLKQRLQLQVTQLTSLALSIMLALVTVISGMSKRLVVILLNTCDIY